MDEDESGTARRGGGKGGRSEGEGRRGEGKMEIAETKQQSKTEANHNSKQVGNRQAEINTSK